MTEWTDGARWRGRATAALLLLAGGVLGILVDRLWLSPPEAQATPLTAHGLAARLNLPAAEEARLRVLLDSLHVGIVAAVQHGPDSLRAAVGSAQRQIEEALPAGSRAEFRAWIREQHAQIGRPHAGADHRAVEGGTP